MINLSTFRENGREEQSSKRLCQLVGRIRIICYASVAEPADAWDLKSQGGNTVRVQFSPFAPKFLDSSVGRNDGLLIRMSLVRVQLGEPFFVSLAQSAEHLTFNQGVPDSSSG